MTKQRNVILTTKIGTDFTGSDIETTLQSTSEELASAGHWGWQNPGRNNVGGDFWLTSSGFIRTPSAERTIRNQFGGTRTSKYVTNITSSISAATLLPDSYGSDAYKRMKPTKPNMDILNSIYEFKDIPMMLKQRFHPNLKNISDFHLSLQFGWLPLWNDVKDFVYLQRNAQKILDQFIRDEGKPVRRRVKILDEELSSIISDTTTAAAFYPSTNSSYFESTPRQLIKEVIRKRVWASARFRYWLPPGPRDIYWTRKMLARIYGFRLSPAVVYNAVPWSWLVDWFSSVGDMIENMDAGVADRIAADYFYVMAREDRLRSIECTGLLRPVISQVGTGQLLTASTERFNVSKRRSRGDPFGFNTSVSSLTGMQLSILGALGMSRLK